MVRLAHSADLRSRLRHVSSAPSVAYSTGCSRVVTHPGTNPARRCLTSVIWREPVCHRRLAVGLKVWKSNARHRESFLATMRKIPWQSRKELHLQLAASCGVNHGLPPWFSMHFKSIGTFLTKSANEKKSVRSTKGGICGVRTQRRSHHWPSTSGFGHETFGFRSAPSCSYSIMATKA